MSYLASLLEHYRLEAYLDMREFGIVLPDTLQRLRELAACLIGDES